MSRKLCYAHDYEWRNKHLFGVNSLKKQQKYKYLCANIRHSYEWGYTYGPPMAVAPLAAVRRVLDYAVSEMPPEKIFMGFPNYAYDWTLPYQAGSTRAELIGNEAAVQLAVRVGAEIRFDETAQTPWFTYTGSDGQVHEVWFEDPRSCLAKFRLPAEYGLHGLGVWNFMRPFTAAFSLMNYLFRLGESVDN
mgnify:CR=1 FL=1